MEFRDRVIVEKFALLLQAAALPKTAPDFVAEAFCLLRLSKNKNLSFGTLPVGIEVEKSSSFRAPEENNRLRIHAN